MTDEIKIVQLNIHGILSYEIQQKKCLHLNHLLDSKQIDIVLLQEWSATKHQPVQSNTNIFPQKFFPNYSVHFHSTECAILYHNGLCVTPLSLPPNYLKPDHRQNFHICGILLHSQSTEYAIYSVYRPQKANVSQLFSYPFESDHIIIGGDFNIHHPIWGSKNACKNGNTFLNLLTNSNLKLINLQTPTRLDPHNGTLTCIDLTLSSHNISNINWRVNHSQHNPQISDHFEIIFSIPLKPNITDNIYHSTWNLSSKNKWNKYKKSLNNSLTNFQPPPKLK